MSDLYNMPIGDVVLGVGGTLAFLWTAGLIMQSHQRRQQRRQEQRLEQRRQEEHARHVDYITDLVAEHRSRINKTDES